MSKNQPTKLAVVRTEPLTPHMLRVIFGGDGFASYLARHNNWADCYVKLVFLDPDVDYPEPLDLDRVRAVLPPESWPVLRTYTIRWVDPVAQELAIDFVIHGDEGYAGPWAVRAQPGDSMHLRGPGGAYSPDPDADWHLFVGDEAALPAIGAALERLEPGAKAVAFVEVADASEQQPLPTKANLELHWLHRGTAAPGSTALLDAAVRAFDWLPGRVHAFIHGEAALLKSVRPYVRNDRAVPRPDVSVSGYWRRGNTEESFRVWKSQHRD